MYFCGSVETRRHYSRITSTLNDWTECVHALQTVRQQSTVTTCRGSTAQRSRPEERLATEEFGDIALSPVIPIQCARKLESQRQPCAFGKRSHTSQDSASVTNPRPQTSRLKNSTISSSRYFQLLGMKFQCQSTYCGSWSRGSLDSLSVEDPHPLRRTRRASAGPSPEPSFGA